MLRLESRPPNIEGEGEVTIRDLVRNSLRMRPDRIIVGEVRGAEALDMLQAMNTGHDGSLTTLHANTPRDALARIETMVLMAGFDLPVRAIRQQVASALDLIVHLERLQDGTRRVTAITEVQRHGGRRRSRCRTSTSSRSTASPARPGQRPTAPTGLRPSFVHKFEKHGLTLPSDLFSAAAAYPRAVRSEAPRRIAGACRASRLPALVPARTPHDARLARRRPAISRCARSS